MTTATFPPPLSAVPRPNTDIGPTLAELLALLDRLGGIPANRVRMWPVPGTATKADAVHSKDWYGVLCESIDGTLVEKAVGLYESAIAQALGVVLGNYNDEHDPGLVAGADGMYTVVPDQIRLPDLSLTLWSRMPHD